MVILKDKGLRESTINDTLKVIFGLERVQL